MQGFLDAFQSMPVWLTNVMSVLFGLVIGSFTNVLVARLPHGKSIRFPGSQCPHCQKPVRWFDNIPVASYLALRGQCRSCKAPISVRYPIIELTVALLFLATRQRFGWSPMLFIRDWPFVTILTAVTFIDLEHRIIPDVLSLPGILLGLATSWMVPEVGLVPSLIGAALGFGLFYGLAWVYLKRSGRAGLGGGDIKLLAMLGAFLGPHGVLATILVSSITGSLVGIAWAYLSRQKNMMSVAIPYGPFLVIGGLYFYLIGELWFQFMTPT